MTLLQFPAPLPKHGSAPPDALERERALEIDRSWIVEAPAGSGKTGLLILRFLKILAVVDEPEAVLALTFTRKATAEMRHRLLDALDRGGSAADPTWNSFQSETWTAARAALKRDGERGWRLRENPERLRISTIDGRCSEIAASMPVLLGGIGSAIPTEQPGELYREAARRVTLQLGGSDLQLTQALQTVLLQRDVNLLECEELIAEMLATREQWASLVPLSREHLDSESLDREVLPQLNDALCSLHCSALRSLKVCFPPDRLREVAAMARDMAAEPGYKGEPNPVANCGMFSIDPGVEPVDLDHWEMLMGLLLTKAGEWRSSHAVNHIGFRMPQGMQARLRELIQELAEDHRLLPLLRAVRTLPPGRFDTDEAGGGRQWIVAKSLFLLLHHALIELRLLFAERGVCDFTELSLAARTALRDDGERYRASSGLQHLLVDEVQDTSTAQYELLESLTAGWNGRDETVFLVGDPKQSIYLFRQARVEGFLRSIREERIGEIPLGVVRLSANFRSGAALVRSFNGIFGGVFNSPPGGIAYGAADAVLPVADSAEATWELSAMDSLRPLRSQDRERVNRYEAERIAGLVSEWRDRPLPTGRTEPWRIAVLTRAKGHVSQVLKTFRDRHIPYRAVEMESLGDRPEVLDALAITRTLLHPFDRVAVLAMLRAPWCGLSLHDLHIVSSGDDPQQRHASLRQHARARAALLSSDSQLRLQRTLDVLDAAAENRGRFPLAEAVERVWSALGSDTYLDRASQNNVRRYLELLEQIENENPLIVLNQIDRRLHDLYADAGAVPNAVEIMTIHKAKGLEWDMVLVPGMQRVGRLEQGRLLEWLELPTAATDGRAHVLLAPLPEAGDKTQSLSTYVRAQRSELAREELKRLLYVAVTRGRSRVHLFASLKLKQNGEPEVRKNTLLASAWPAATKHLPDLPTEEREELPLDSPVFALAAASEDADRRPSMERVPVNLDARAGLRKHSPMPTTGVGIPAGASFERPEGSLAARALGNTVHAFLAIIAERRSVTEAPSWEDLVAETAQWHDRVRASLRGEGLPAEEVLRLAPLAMHALQQTLTDADGRWLLSAHREALSEAELPGLGTGRTLRLDRSFVASAVPRGTAPEALWIVDFKTSVDGSRAVDDFLQHERLRYEPQLRSYAGQRPNPGSLPVILALYHPMIPRLTWWRA